MERILEYTRLGSEPARVCDGAPASPPDWPSGGRVAFEGVSACYRPGLPPVLRDLSFTVPVGASLPTCLPILGMIRFVR